MTSEEAPQETQTKALKHSEFDTVPPPVSNKPSAVSNPSKTGQRSQNGLRGRLFAEAEDLTEEEAIAMIPLKQRLFLQRYVELDSAKAAYIEVFQPKNPDSISSQPYRVLEQPKNAAYVKLIRLRAARSSILTLEELARWLSHTILDTSNQKPEQLSAANALIKLAGWNTPIQHESTSQVTHEVVLSLATPPELIDVTPLPQEPQEGTTDVSDE